MPDTPSVSRVWRRFRLMPRHFLRSAFNIFMLSPEGQLHIRTRWASHLHSSTGTKPPRPSPNPPHMRRVVMQSPRHRLRFWPLPLPSMRTFPSPIAVRRILIPHAYACVQAVSHGRLQLQLAQFSRHLRACRLRKAISNSRRKAFGHPSGDGLCHSKCDLVHLATNLGHHPRSDPLTELTYGRLDLDGSRGVRDWLRRRRHREGRLWSRLCCHSARRMLGRYRSCCGCRLGGACTLAVVALGGVRLWRRGWGRCPTCWPGTGRWVSGGDDCGCWRWRPS